MTDSDEDQMILDFDEYIRQGERSKKETAWKHIKGEIDIDEARQLINTYYQSKTQRKFDYDEQQEADKVEVNIYLFACYSWYFRNALVSTN